MADTGKRNHPANLEGEQDAVRELLRYIRRLTRRSHTGRAEICVAVNCGIIKTVEAGSRAFRANRRA